MTFSTGFCFPVYLMGVLYGLIRLNSDNSYLSCCKNNQKNISEKGKTLKWSKTVDCDAFKLIGLFVFCILLDNILAFVLGFDTGNAEESTTF